MSSSSVGAAGTSQAASALRGMLDAYRAFVEGGSFDGVRDWDADCLGLAQVTFTHAWGVVTLMESDSALLLPGAAAARAAWESAIICRWILAAADETVRMRRWLGYMSKNAAYFRDMAKEFSRTDVGRPVEAEQAMKVAATGAIAEAEAIEKGVADTVQNFAAKGTVGDPIHLPNVYDMAEKVGKLKQYYIYRELSQFVHGNPRILQHVREHLSAAEQGQPGLVQIRYRIVPKNWALPYGCAGEAVMIAAEAIAERADRSADVETTLRPAWESFVQAMQTLFPSADVSLG